MESRLTDREIEVCKRLRKIRLWLKWSMPNFAEASGISRDRLASYEYGRAPLRYWLAKKICARFDINQRWLATGAEPQRPYFGLEADFEGEIDQNRLFSEVYDNLLKGKIEERLGEIARLIGVNTIDLIRPENAELFREPKLGPPFKYQTSEFLEVMMQAGFALLPENLMQPYVEKLTEASKRFFEQHRSQIEAALLEGRQPSPAIPKKNLPPMSKSIDNGHGPDNIEAVSNPEEPLPQLMRRLRRLVDSRGAQSRLARELCVTRQAVSNWLGNVSFPSAGTAFRLLYWVEAEEMRRKNSPGSVVAQPGQKTPKGLHPHEPPTRSNQQSARKPKKSST